MIRASSLLLAVTGTVFACGISGDSVPEADRHVGLNTICVATGPDSPRYIVAAGGFYEPSDDSVARSIPVTWGTSEVVVDHNGAASTLVAAVLRDRSVGRLEVDQDRRALLVVLDSLGVTSEGVGVGGSIACLKSLWGEVRGEADESGVLVWRDEESPFSYRLDRGLVSGDARVGFEQRLSGEARVVAVLVALDRIPNDALLRLSRP